MDDLIKRTKEQNIDDIVSCVLLSANGLSLNEGDILIVACNLIEEVLKESRERKNMILEIEKIVFKWRHDYGQ